MNISNISNADRPEFKSRPEQKAKPENICRTAVRFGRMWGVMETLGKLPPMRTAEEKESICSRYEELVLAWAEEYAAGESADPVRFFERKMNAVISGEVPG